MEESVPSFTFCFLQKCVKWHFLFFLKVLFILPIVVFMKKSVWKKILRVVMAIVSAALGALGGGAMK